AIGVDDLPHHLDDTAAALFIQRAVELAGEVIKIDCLLLGLRGFGQEAVRIEVIEPEPPLDHCVQRVALDVRYGAVNGRGMDQERGSGEPVIVVVELARMLVAAAEFRHEPSEALKHLPLSFRKEFSGRTLNGYSQSGNIPAVLSGTTNQRRSTDGKAAHRLYR